MTDFTDSQFEARLDILEAALRTNDDELQRLQTRIQDAMQMQERCAKLLDDAGKIYRSVPTELNPFAVIRAEECESRAAQIRALK